MQARLVDDVRDAASPLPAQKPVPSQPSPPRRRASPPPTRDDRSDADSDDDEHVPTVDELAKSFIRTEPAEEIRELQEELASQSPYMQESVSSSDDGEEGAAGMGAPLALPAYLRNVLNTALDRLSITVNDIHVEVEDQSSKDAPDASRLTQTSPVSLNFHVERVAIDSMTSKDVRVEVGSTTPVDDTKLGKRRMRVENICARLISDVENFVSLSRFSQPPSPLTNRSQASISQKAPSEPSASRMSIRSTREDEEGSQEPPELPEPPEPPEPPVDEIPASPIPSPPQAPITPREETISPVPSLPPKSPSPRPPSLKSPSPELPSPEQPQLNLSVHTVDDDRFADANSDDGLDDRSVQGSLSHSRQSLPARDLGGSDILYDEDGMLDYAMQNDMLNSRFDDAPNMDASVEVQETWGLDGAASSHHTRMSEPASNASTSDLPTVSALGQ